MTFSRNQWHKKSKQHKGSINSEERSFIVLLRPHRIAWLLICWSLNVTKKSSRASWRKLDKLTYFRGVEFWNAFVFLSNKKKYAEVKKKSTEYPNILEAWSNYRSYSLIEIPTYSHEIICTFLLNKSWEKMISRFFFYKKTSTAPSYFFTEYYF